MNIWLYGAEYSLEDAFRKLLGLQKGLERRDGGGLVRAVQPSDKFAVASTHELIFGRPEAAALGITSYLKLDIFELFKRGSEPRTCPQCTDPSASSAPCTPPH